MIEQIITLVIDEARKRPGAAMPEELFIVWLQVATIVNSMGLKIAAVNASDMQYYEKRRLIDLILTSHKT